MKTYEIPCLIVHKIQAECPDMLRQIMASAVSFFEDPSANSLRIAIPDNEENAVAMAELLVKNYVIAQQ